MASSMIDAKGNAFVVAIDGSKFSTPVLRTAQKMLRKNDTAYLYHAFVRTAYVKPGDQQEMRATKMLAEAAAVMKDHMNVVEVVEPTTDPRKAICEYAELKMAKCVIMGTRGLGGLQRLMMGSTSEFVLNHSQGAVCIVHSEPSGEHITYMVCVDGSAHSQRAANRIACTAREGDTVILLHAFPAPPKFLDNVYLADPDAIMVPSNIENPNYEQDMANAEARAATLLHAVKHNFVTALEDNPAKASVKVHTAMQASADVRDTIIKKLDELNVDIVVVGSRGEGNFARTIFGSVSSYIVRNVENHAVMVVH